MGLVSSWFFLNVRNEDGQFAETHLCNSFVNPPKTGSERSVVTLCGATVTCKVSVNKAKAAICGACNKEMLNSCNRKLYDDDRG